MTTAYDERASLSLGPDYRRPWSSPAASDLAHGILVVALPLFAVRLTDSPLRILSGRLPWLVFTPVAEVRYAPLGCYRPLMTATRFGTFDELMAETDEALRPIAERLRQIVFEVHPSTVEVVRLGDRAATYGVGPRKMSEGYCYVLPYRQWVNLGFYQGAGLPDPEGLLEGTGARLRHVKVRSLPSAEEPAIRRLVEVALEERLAALGR